MRPPGRVGELVQAHQLMTFLVVTFALSWAYWGVALGHLGRTGLWWYMPGAFGPPVAAVLITGLTEGWAGVRAFLHRLVQWRVKPRWYLVALVVLPLTVAVAGLPLRDGSERINGSIATVVITYVAWIGMLALLGGGQEEPGWRGFALPRLQERFNPVIGSLILGVLWGVWHLPLFLFVPEYNSAGRDVAGIAVTFAAFTLAAAVGQSLLLTWLYNHTRGSLLLAVLAHASFNAGWGFVATNQQASITVFLVLLGTGALVALATRGRLGLKKSDEAADADVAAGVGVSTPS
jgi:membrane protease YdiL (CAAX protease family)